MVGERPRELVVARRIQRGKLAEGRVGLGQCTPPPGFSRIKDRRSLP